MSFQGWLVFATFWVVFVTTPGPNAVNCIQNGMTFGFRRALWGVLAILLQASLFLILSAAGLTALLAASPELFFWVRMLGALVLIGLGIRSWLLAATPPKVENGTGKSIFWKAFAVATINAKSVAGYLAAFSQFVEPGVPMSEQMVVIFPTALAITAASYLTYTAVGAGLGRLALGAVLNTWFRRAMAVLFVVYGVLLGLSGPQARTG